MFRDSAVYFLCDNNEVISVLGRCDGNEDCADQSDEAGCDVTTSGIQEFKCGYMQTSKFTFSRKICGFYADGVIVYLVNLW